MKLSLTAIIVLLVLALVLTPFLVVWSLNTLFPALVIPYNMDTWLAVIVLNMTVASTLKAMK